MKYLIEEDLFKIKMIGDSQISKDGKRIAYVQMNMLEIKDTYNSDIYIVANGQTSCVTDKTSSNSFPRWSPDNKNLLYISNCSGINALYLYDFKSTTKIVELKNGVSFPVWSPDGKKIAFMSKKDSGVNKPYREVKRLKQKMDALGGFIDYSKVNHIYTYTLENQEIEQVTPDDFSLEPAEWSSSLHPSWSSDSKKLTFAAKILDPVARDLSPWKANVFVLDLESKSVKGIKHVVGPASKPIWSQNDETIYFVGHTNEFQRATTQKLCQIDIETETYKVLSTELNRGLDNYVIDDVYAGYNDIFPKISPEMNELYFTGGKCGSTILYGMNLKTHAIREVISGERCITDFSISDDQKIAFIYANDQSPGALAVYDLATNEETKLTKLNEQFLSTYKHVKQEPIAYTSEDGLVINGWLMKPVDYIEGQKYPTILHIHGGPMLAYGNSYTYEFQWMCHLGYAVIFCNPRGSRGYSQEFTYALKDNYGKNDFTDIMGFVDLTIATGVVDEERLGVTGTSYGGFMTNWIMTHTDRFKAAIPQASVTNWMTMYGMSDFGFMTNELLLMEPFKNLVDLWNISPLAYAENVTTPVLLIQNENDMRCPMEQAEQMFVRLKHLGKNVEMIRFPDSNHMMMRSGKPSLRIARLEAMKEFFNKYV